MYTVYICRYIYIYANRLPSWIKQLHTLEVAGAELSSQALNELLPSNLAYAGCAAGMIDFVASEFKPWPPESQHGSWNPEQMRITTATYSHNQAIHVGKKEKNKP